MQLIYGCTYDLTGAEDTKRWQEYTEEICKKDLHGPDIHNYVNTHLQPDILEYEVKWALGSTTTNKASGGDGIPVELFKILKDDAVKVLHSICQQIWKTQQWPQDWKRSVFIPIPKKGNAKEFLNYCTIALISHTSKVMLKIFQARLQQYVNHELPDVQAGFRNGGGTRDKIANIDWIIKKMKHKTQGPSHIRIPKGKLLLKCLWKDGLPLHSSQGISSNLQTIWGARVFHPVALLKLMFL